MPVELWPVMQHRMDDYREPARQVGLRRRATPTSRPACSPRSASRVRRPPATSTTDCPAPRSTGAGTGRTPAGARLPLHRRRPGHRRPQQPVRGAATTCPSGCCRPTCWPGRRPRWPTPSRELVRRAAVSHGVATVAVPARLLPDAGRGDEAGGRRAGRGRRAGAGADPRAGTGRRTSTATPRCRAGSTRGRCSARSTRWCGSGRGPRRSSTSTTASRSTCRPHKRVHGYYVLPFLLGDQIVGAGRPQGRPATGRLLVRSGAYAEPGAPDDTAEELAAELRRARGLAGPRRRRRRAAR